MDGWCLAEEDRKMDEILTLAEIEERYESEWIVVEDPELDEHLNVIRGKVVVHGKDRDGVYEKALKLKPRRPAFLYTGTLPDDIVLAL